LTVCISNES